ncbi:hypothetical protein I7I51_07239 [Histoplasma capsulatum]|uniref:Uncharacterized protein n=1 Tax=Ajellomyces capsulatus TaxID=5037 RepID=A0A8A1MP14_AJECA|nr:hypothetical protein I7I51_07239 [Histoplasma capsulatum]
MTDAMDRPGRGPWLGGGGHNPTRRRSTEYYMLHTMYSTSHHDNVFCIQSIFAWAKFPRTVLAAVNSIRERSCSKICILGCRSNPTAWLMITLDWRKEWMASAQVNDRPWDDSIDSCWGKPYRLASVCARNALFRNTNFIALQTTAEAM